MKIYCSRYDNDSELLDSLVGRNAWVYVMYDNYAYWMRIFESNKYAYTCYMVIDYISYHYSKETMLDAIRPFQSDYPPEYLIKDHSLEVLKDDVSIIKPVEVYDSKELIEMVKSSDNYKIRL